VPGHPTWRGRLRGVVPSSTGRAEKHALELVIQHAPPVEQEHATLLRRGPRELGHNLASDDGYGVMQSVTGPAASATWSDWWELGCPTRRSQPGCTSSKARSRRMSVRSWRGWGSGTASSWRSWAYEAGLLEGH
jgi:hypothetical protein